MKVFSVSMGSYDDYTRLLFYGEGDFDKFKSDVKEITEEFYDNFRVKRVIEINGYKVELTKNTLKHPLINELLDFLNESTKLIPEVNDNVDGLFITSDERNECLWISLVGENINFVDTNNFEKVCKKKQLKIPECVIFSDFMIDWVTTFDDILIRELEKRGWKLIVPERDVYVPNDVLEDFKEDE